jgi:hypothetical protein
MNINGVEYDTIITVDPGSNGSIVSYRDNIVKSVDMPSEISKLQRYLEYCKSISKRVFAVIEKQSLWVGDMSLSKFDIDSITDEDMKKKLQEYMQKNREQAAKVFRLQKLFENYNTIKLLFTQLGFDYLPVASISWQSTLGLVNRNESKSESLTDKKNRHKEMAQASFRGIVVTHKNADALLLLYFVLHKSKFNPEWFKDKSGTKIFYSKTELL